MSAPMARYRALKDCRAGGLFRRAGDVFEMPALASVPAHLKEVCGSASVPKSAGKPKIGKPASVPKSAQVGKADIGAAAPTPVQDVTSVDMVTK